MERIECDICPKNCLLTANGKGFCGYRIENLGNFAAGNLDPIEKKPLYHVNPGSFTLSLGGVGCNLNCPWCQNWSISKENKKLVGNKLSYLKQNELLNLLINQKMNSLTITYNEPSISYEYIIYLNELLSKNNIETYIVSNGYISKKYLEGFYENVTAANIDLKCFNKDTYKNIIGGDLDVVLETIKYINNSKTWLELTTLLVPGINDSKEEITNLINWVKNSLGVMVPLHFTAFHPSYKYKDVPKTKDKSVINAVEMAYEAGLKYVYSGNIKSNKYTNTFCPNCGDVIITRETNVENNLINFNHCPKCNRIIEGIFR